MAQPWTNKTFLKTYELTTEILNLISSTKSYCYIVSPYIKIWPQLERVLEIASKQETILTFVIREDPKSSTLLKTLNHEYGFEVIVIKDLHIKLYLNEESCLLSTMNLYDASQQNNLELGYYFSNSAEIKKDIIENYILADKTAVRYSGKFEEKRKEVLKRVSEAKEVLSQLGYCVDCQIRINPDFNPWTPRVIRCRDCYFKSTDLNGQIQFCHFCGEAHNSTGDHPFHHSCRQKIKTFKMEVKNYR
jgi:hypothetical protein